MSNKMPHYRTAYLELFGRRFGVEFSRVFIGDAPYLDRYILYIGGPTLRLHKFWTGDDARAFHTHPWSWYTFPLKGYWEQVSDVDNGRYIGRQFVKAFRWHKRPASYRHIVEGAYDGKPFWTLCVTGARENAWGFYPEPNKFVPWREWK